jgi:hypothetical protein
MFCAVNAAARFFQMADFPHPGFPIMKTLCLTTKISANYTHFKTNPSSG